MHITPENPNKVIKLNSMIIINNINIANRIIHILLNTQNMEYKTSPLSKDVYCKITKRLERIVSCPSSRNMKLSIKS